MSRIGKKPIPVPSGVDVAVDDGVVTVKGPKGNLEQSIPPEVSLVQDGEELRVERPDDAPRTRAMHGLTRSLVANMVEGVTNGYKKELEIVGIGYRCAAKGKGLEIQVGYSHPVVFDAPEGISLSAPAPTQIVVEGIDKQLVGQVAAEIRRIRPPEPYKGKGIRYAGEHVRRKAGKTGA